MKSFIDLQFIAYFQNRNEVDLMIGKEMREEIEGLITKEINQVACDVLLYGSDIKNHLDNSLLKKTKDENC